MSFEEMKRLYAQSNNPVLAEYFSQEDYRESIKDPSFIRGLECSRRNLPLAINYYSNLDKNYLALNLLGLYYSQSTPKLAKKYFLKAIKLGNVHSKHNLIKLYFTRNPRDVRIAKLGLESLKGGIIPSAFILGLYHSQGDPVKAIFYYKQFIPVDPGMAYLFIARTHKKTENHDKEIKYLKRAMSLGEKDAILELAKCYEKHRPIKAEKYFLKAASEAGRNHECALYYCHSQNCGKSDPFYLKAIQSNHPAAFANYLRCLVKKGRYAEAIDLIKNYSKKSDRGLCRGKISYMIRRNYLTEKDYRLFVSWGEKKFYRLVTHEGIRILYRTYSEKIDLIGLPFEYSPGKVGYKKAIKDFSENVFIQQISQ